MPNRARTLVYALGILLALSACKKDKGSRAAKVGPKPCPEITATLKPVSTNPETQNPVMDGNNRLSAFANRNTQWVVEVQGGEPPYQANINGLPGITGPLKFEGNQSGIINSTFRSSERPSLFPAIESTVGLTVEVTDSTNEGKDACKSKPGTTQLDVRGPLPKSANWASARPFQPTPSQPQIVGNPDEGVATLPVEPGDLAVVQQPVGTASGHRFQ